MLFRTPNGRDSEVEICDLSSAFSVPQKAVENAHVLRLPNQTTKRLSAIEAGLVPGTLVSTAKGVARVETLAVGDRVLTRDAGFQIIEWVERTSLQNGGPHKDRHQELVRIPAGVLCENSPTQDLLVASNQLVLVQSARAELHFGAREVLVPAAAFKRRAVRDAKNAIMPKILTVIGCASHHVIAVQGAWMATCARLHSLDTRKPDKASRVKQRLARPLLNLHEAALIISD